MFPGPMMVAIANAMDKEITTLVYPKQYVCDRNHNRPVSTCIFVCLKKQNPTNAVANE